MDAGKPPSTGWRFTLRELFLATLTVAVLLGWGTTLYRHANQGRTPFFENWDADIIGALEGFGEPQLPHQEEWFGGNRKGSGYWFEQYRFKLHSSQADGFMKAYEKRICGRINSFHCGPAEVARGLDHDGPFIWVGYQHNSIEGSLHVKLIPYAPGEARLRILLFEGRKL